MGYTYISLHIIICVLRPLKYYQLLRMQLKIITNQRRIIVGSNSVYSSSQQTTHLFKLVYVLIIISIHVFRARSTRETIIWNFRIYRKCYLTVSMYYKTYKVMMMAGGMGSINIKTELVCTLKHMAV